MHLTRSAESSNFVRGLINNIWGKLSRYIFSSTSFHTVLRVRRASWRSAARSTTRCAAECDPRAFQRDQPKVSPFDRAEGSRTAERRPPAWGRSFSSRCVCGGTVDADHLVVSHSVVHAAASLWDVGVLTSVVNLQSYHFRFDLKSLYFRNSEGKKKKEKKKEKRKKRLIYSLCIFGIRRINVFFCIHSRIFLGSVVLRLCTQEITKRASLCFAHFREHLSEYLPFSSLAFFRSWCNFIGLSRCTKFSWHTMNFAQYVVKFSD